MRPLTRLPVSTDVGDVSADVRRLFDELGRQRPERRQQITGECLPLLDVFETQDALDLVLDVPGVAAANLRILVKGGVVIVAGEKERPDPRPGPASYHLVERDFGRFARAVRVHVAVDAAQAPRHAARRRAAHRAAEDPRATRRGIAVPITDGAGVVKLLFIGDIVGRPGRDLVQRGVPALVARHAVDLVIANGENAAGGVGITRDIGEQLFALGIDVHHVGQSHLGQARSARVHRRSSRGCCVRPTTPPARPAPARCW